MVSELLLLEKRLRPPNLRLRERLALWLGYAKSSSPIKGSAGIVALKATAGESR
jgi:hypothetical protein